MKPTILHLEEGQYIFISGGNQVSEIINNKDIKDIKSFVDIFYEEFKAQR